MSHSLLSDGPLPVTTDASEQTPSARRELSVSLVGNVLTNPIAKIWQTPDDELIVRATNLAFGQVVQQLNTHCSSDILIVHLDHRWFFSVAPDAEAVGRAEELVEGVRGWLERNPGSVILNTLPHVPQSSVESDLHLQIEHLATIHGKLFKLARESERVSVLDVAGLLARIGYASAVRERNRYIVQMPYSPVALQAIANGYRAIMLNTVRARRKVIVLDADNTLWGGVVAEDGVDGIAIDQEYPGILYYNFQQQVRRLQAMGVLICVVTKNNEEDFLEVFQERAMPIKLEDIACYKSNWKTKSENIEDISRELNLGLDSFLFIDDNPFEIEEVQSQLPDVECHLFPKDSPEAIIDFLGSIQSLNTRTVTSEDLGKTEQYRTEAARTTLRRSSVSLDDYLSSLNIEIHISINNLSHVRRVAQLANKTNQFNLTTRRYTEAQVEGLMKTARVYDCRLVDRFGDMGVIGVVIVNDGAIESFLLSCRALGRNVECQLLKFVCDDHGDAPLTAEFIPTAKNVLVENFYENNGFEVIQCDDGRKSYVYEGGAVGSRHVKTVRN